MADVKQEPYFGFRSEAELARVAAGAEQMNTSETVFADDAPAEDAPAPKRRVSRKK